MTLETDGSSVAGLMWTTTQQTWHQKASCSMYVRQQLGEGRLATLDSLTGGTTRTKRLTAGQPGQRRDWVVRSIVAQVRARLYTSITGVLMSM